MVKCLFLDDSNSFNLPIYVFKVQHKENTFPYLLIYTLIYYYSHINQILLGIEESFIELNHCKSICRKFGIRNPVNLLIKILEEDPNFILTKKFSDKIFYKVNDFELSSIRVPKILKDNIEKLRKIVTVKFDPDRRTGLFLLFKIIELFYKINKTWYLTNTITDENINELINSFDLKERSKFFSYLNYFKQIKLLVFKGKNFFKLNFEITEDHTWAVIPHTYRDRQAFRITRKINNLLNHDYFNTIYDVITRLRVHFFDLEKNNKGRFLLALPNDLPEKINILDISHGKGKISDFLYKLSKEQQVWIGGKKIYGKVNRDYPEGLWGYYDYRAGKIINRLLINRKTMASLIILRLLLQNNYSKIISNSDGGIKIKFREKIDAKSIEDLKKEGIHYDIEGNIIIIPPADIFQIIERLNKREKSMTSSEIIRDYRSAVTENRRGGYFFGFLTNYINNNFNIYSQKENMIKIKPLYSHCAIAYSDFEYIDLKALYRDIKDRKLKKKLNELRNSLSPAKYLVDFYMVISLITKDNTEIPEGTQIMLVFDKDIIEDVDKRNFYYESKRIVFKYTQHMPLVNTKKDCAYQEHIGWILLKKDSPDFHIHILIDTGGKISGKDIIKCQIRLDFYMNYFEISGNMKDFTTFWKDYKKYLSLLDNYLEQPWPVI